MLKMTQCLLFCLLVPVWLTVLVGCTAARIPGVPAELGTVRALSELEEALQLTAKKSGLQVTTIESARWQVDREGLINLDHPTALREGKQSGPEPIAIFTHIVRHPEQGSFLIDTGVAAAFSEPDEMTAVSWLVRGAMGMESLKLQTPTRQLHTAAEPIQGVFLTHLHLDHVLGFTDLPEGVATYAGPGETATRSFMNLFSQGSMNRLLAPVRELREWTFSGASVASSLAVIDVFGDGTFWALHVPGHTPGSTAYVALAEDGPHLYLGDACHTAWGWEYGVEPGSFSEDLAGSARSLAALRALVARHPEIHVHPGHQELAQAVVLQ